MQLNSYRLNHLRVTLNKMYELIQTSAVCSPAVFDLTFFGLSFPPFFPFGFAELLRQRSDDR